MPDAPESNCPEPSLLPDAVRGRLCGAQIAADGRCLAHLAPHDLDAYLGSLRPGSPLACNRVVFTSELLTRLLRAVANEPAAAHFGDATFTGDADFGGVTFTEVADFSGVTFTEGAGFSGVTFTEGADFSGVSFVQTAWFTGARFAKSATFARATFSEQAGFNSVAFAEDADFSAVTFTQVASFGGATFSRDAFFSTATFIEEADFTGTDMRGSARLRCRASSLNFSRSVISGELSVEGAVAELLCRDMRSTGRVAFRLRGTDVDAENAVFAGLFTVHGLQNPIAGIDESQSPRDGGGIRRTSVVSLCGVDADRLVLTDVDLSRCRFAGIHRLDQIILDGRCTFASDPSGSRQVLAEEQHWRATLPGRRAARWRAAPDGAEVVGPERLEVIYRQLRKAFEEAKNEPGAAGFYYGEMQMRRAAAAFGRDRWLLNAYWATSGYTMRVRRALACLALVVAATITAMTLWGFPTKGQDMKADGTLATPSGTSQTIKVAVHRSDPARKLPERISKATEITLNAVIFRNADTDLTTAGRYIDVAARILGPLFLGFSLLAIRNRVRR